MKIMVVLAVLPLLLGGVASQQCRAQTAAIQPACGPDQIKYDTQKAKQPSVLSSASASPTNGISAKDSPATGSALIYVVSQLDFGGYPIGCQVVTRIGVDGKWLGANCGNSYLSAVVPAGEHHLCADWQSKVVLSSLPRPALNGFTAEAGKTYYFRARAVYIKGLISLDLDPVNPDEGQSLIASVPASISTPKK